MDDAQNMPLGTDGSVGTLLRTVFDDFAAQPLPPIFLELLDQLEDVERATRGEAPEDLAGRLNDAQFKKELSQIIPHLRAFGRSLSGNRDLADDLVQETLLKAWAARARFQAGTNMRAWTFIILRNLFLSQMRRARFKGEWDDVLAARILSAPASQDKEIELSDLQHALMRLPQAQREALILVGAGGFAYEEAAAICNCAVGTIKSRVARGRTALEVMMENDAVPSRRDTPTGLPSALDQIMNQVNELVRD